MQCLRCSLSCINKSWYLLGCQGLLRHSKAVKPPVVGTKVGRPLLPEFDLIYCRMLKQAWLILCSCTHHCCYLFGTLSQFARILLCPKKSISLFQNFSFLHPPRFQAINSNTSSAAVVPLHGQNWSRQFWVMTWGRVGPRECFSFPMSFRNENPKLWHSLSSAVVPTVCSYSLFQSW